MYISLSMHTICPTYHVPVLLHPTVDGLNMRPDGVYIDATFGGGGHSEKYLPVWEKMVVCLVLTKMQMPW